MKTIEKSAIATLTIFEKLPPKETRLFTLGGVNMNSIDIPVPFSEAELRRAHELGQYLIFQTNMSKDGEPISIKEIHYQLGNKLGDGKLLYTSINWCKKEPFSSKDIPILACKLVIWGRGARLNLNMLFHGKPVEVIYGLVVLHGINHECLLPNIWSFSTDSASDSVVVCDLGGVRVYFDFQLGPDRNRYGLMYSHRQFQLIVGPRHLPSGIGAFLS